MMLNKNTVFNEEFLNEFSELSKISCDVENRLNTIQALRIMNKNRFERNKENIERLYITIKLNEELTEDEEDLLNEIINFIQCYVKNDLIRKWLREEEVIYWDDMGSFNKVYVCKNIFKEIHMLANQYTMYYGGIKKNRDDLVNIEGFTLIKESDENEI